MSGSLAYVPGGVYPLWMSSVVWIDRDGESTPLPLAPGRYLTPRFSPDGTRLAYTEWAFPQPHHNVWIYDIELQTPLRLATTIGQPALAWSPDSTRLAFFSPEMNALAWMAADGSGTPGRLMPSTRPEGPNPSSWSRDNVLAFVQDGDIWTLVAEAGSDPRPFVASSAREMWPAFSPDGRWLAYGSDETGRFEVYVRPFPAGEPVFRVSIQGGREPVWSPDQRQLFFRPLLDNCGPPPPTNLIMHGSNCSLMAVDVTRTDHIFRQSQPLPLFDVREFISQSPLRGYDVAPDGTRFVSRKAPVREPQPVTSVNIVQNWFVELKRLAPAR